ncbi:MAG TPA: hypothetical protein QGF58_25790, partial [Myxococcota bacterium]|nr:hypothetical protein [Myxococcota bacterium]
MRSSTHRSIRNLFILALATSPGLATATAPTPCETEAAPPGGGSVWGDAGYPRIATNIFSSLEQVPGGGLSDESVEILSVFDLIKMGRSESNARLLLPVREANPQMRLINHLSLAKVNGERELWESDGIRGKSRPISGRWLAYARPTTVLLAGSESGFEFTVPLSDARTFIKRICVEHTGRVDCDTRACEEGTAESYCPEGEGIETRLSGWAPNSR